MMFRTFRSRLALSMIGILLAISGCTPRAAHTPPSSEFTVVTSPSSTAPTFTATPRPSPTPLPNIKPTQTHQAVTVTAVKGNLFIRRGPDLAFNSVGVLMDGQNAMARARDVLGKWLQISLPGHPDETGWVSIQSHYSVVSGDVMSLPEIEPTDWPVLASLRNCTFHQMQITPGGIVIPAVDNFPENEIQINPGVYTIHDANVDGSPEVAQIEIKEGSEIDIRDDGEGNHKKCAMS